VLAGPLQIEAEMRAAWNITTKFVNRWSHRHEPAAEQGASRRSPARSQMAVGRNRCTPGETRRSCRRAGFGILRVCISSESWHTPKTFRIP